jgi:hypothetical protein
MTLYLYKKTHNVTGLKYLGKTVSKDPFSYPGSGIHWKRHLNKHGNDVTTEILKECETEQDLIYWGKYYSKLWNIVNSKEWANLIEEAGPGGSWGEKSKKKLSNTKKKELARLSSEERKQRVLNSCCKPESYTKERIEKARLGTIGKKKTKTEAWLKNTPERIARIKRVGALVGAQHKGKTWKLINGKRVWLVKEN